MFFFGFSTFKKNRSVLAGLLRLPSVAPLKSGILGALGDARAFADRRNANGAGWLKPSIRVSRSACF